MSKNPSTLVKDVYALFSRKGAFSHEGVSAFADSLAKRIADRLITEHTGGVLRLSSLGSPCDRKLWYQLNRPEREEPLKPALRLSFLFGDILEELLLWLAVQAGHKVERHQETVELHGVVGHIDAVVDGHVLDVKSTSSRNFDKFADGTLASDDPFGYCTQLDGYIHATPYTEDTGYFFAVDKQYGNLAVLPQKKTNKNYEELIENKRQMLAFPLPPKRAFEDQADGASGNRKLKTECRYCPFKFHCWPGLRAFHYSNGIRYLTTVKVLPKVPEVT